MIATYKTVLEALPEFSAEGKRLRASDGGFTNAAFREASVQLYVSRGATRERAEWLAGQKITTSKRGTVAFVVGGSAAALTAKECEIVGRPAGPGNN